MRTAILLLAATAVLTVTAEAQKPCAVARIVDGDTFVCTDSARVRLLLIDAPEISQEPYGQRAAEALTELLPVGSVVELEQDVQPLDRYGRKLAHIRMADARLANLEMVRRGYAVVSVYPPNVRHVERFRAARDTARAERRGLWATEAFECEPAEHRRGACEHGDTTASVALVLAVARARTSGRVCLARREAPRGEPAPCRSQLRSRLDLERVRRYRILGRDVPSPIRRH